MKNKALLRGSLIIVLAAAILSGATASHSQTSYDQKAKEIFAERQELRPFDFSDAYYVSNGIDPKTLIDRRDGNDKMSVVDFINDPNHRDVRITATFPAYDRDGGILFWNIYAEVPKFGFLENSAGAYAVSIAEQYPVYTFPSTSLKSSMRQAALIEADAAYYEKNSLGLGVVLAVDYTDKIDSKEAQELLDSLAKQNGLSADKTPIIKTSRQIMQLLLNGLVTLKRRGTDDPNQSPYMVAKVMRDPGDGGIAADAKLWTVLQPDGKPLAAEIDFVQRFECLKTGGSFCKR